MTVATNGPIFPAYSLCPNQVTLFCLFAFISLLLVILKLLWSSTSCSLSSCLVLLLLFLFKFTVSYLGFCTVLGIPNNWSVKPWEGHGRSSLGSLKTLKSCATSVRMDLLLSSQWVLKLPQIRKGPWPKNGKGHWEVCAPRFQHQRGRAHCGRVCCLVGSVSCFLI